MEFKFDFEENAEKITEFESFINEKKDEEGSLMAMLHKGQSLFGYLPIEVQQMISEDTGIPLAEIYGVATFYSNFSLVPKGDYEVGLCLGTACYVRGAQQVLEELEKELGVSVGGTTPDGKFSLIGTRCIGACGLAPVMTINDDVYGKIEPDKVKEILEQYMDA